MRGKSANGEIDRTIETTTITSVAGDVNYGHFSPIGFFGVFLSADFSEWGGDSAQFGSDVVRDLSYSTSKNEPIFSIE